MRIVDDAGRGGAAYLATVDSPAGPLTFAVNVAGALVRLQFVEGAHPQTIELALARDGYTPARDPERAAEATAEARRQLLEYHTGARQSFDLPLALVGTAWQRRIWRALLAIPFGETRAYGELAAQVGAPQAARAVGRANATNHLPLVVPCHRLIGASGALTGFAGGVGLKARLLAHERAVMRERAR